MSCWFAELAVNIASGLRTGGFAPLCNTGHLDTWLQALPSCQSKRRGGILHGKLGPMILQIDVLPCKFLGAAALSGLLSTFPASSSWAQSPWALTAEDEPMCAPAPGTHSAPALHCIRLIPTAKAAGASGVMKLVLARSPFGLTLTEDGRVVYDIRLELARLRRRPDVVYVAWATTPDLSQRKNLGVIGEDLTVTGQADWNRFMVLVTAESTADLETWRGPILLTAISPSGWMQTMAGEEIFGNNELPAKSRYCIVNKC